MRRDVPLSAHRIVNAMPQLLTNIQLRLFMFSFHQNIIKHSIPDFSPYSTLSLLILQPLHFLQRAWGVSSASARRTVAVHAHEKDFDYVNILRKPTLSQEVSHYIIDPAPVPLNWRQCSGIKLTPSVTHTNVPSHGKCMHNMTEQWRNADGMWRPLKASTP